MMRNNRAIVKRKDTVKTGKFSKNPQDDKVEHIKK